MGKTVLFSKDVSSFKIQYAPKSIKNMVRPSRGMHCLLR